MKRHIDIIKTSKLTVGFKVLGKKNYGGWHAVVLSIGKFDIRYWKDHRSAYGKIFIPSFK